jgi:DNA-cytosine methyltransferase
MIKIGSICSGMGMALHGLGTNVWGIECDPQIADIYTRNHPRSRIICDYVQNVNPEGLKDVDCVIATPSCRNASIANSKAGETDDDLIVANSIVNIIKAKLPKFFVLENVTGYRKFESFHQIKSSLTRQGYCVTNQTLNLKDFGIAQSRERIYLLAIKNQEISNIQLPQIKQIGWYEAIADLIPTLPEITLSKYQKKCEGVSDKCLIRRVGANKANNRAYQPSEPSFTIRAFGRKADNHWNQANVLIDGVVKSVTPRACLRFFGSKKVADKIWLPERKTLAMEVVGNGASWQIIKFLLTHITDKQRNQTLH